jgi:hypothetical protein
VTVRPIALALVYYGSYQSITSTASITLSQYPTRAWTRYETRHVVGVFERPIGDQRVLDDGRGECYWFSDNNVPKYPSGIEPSFPLFWNRSPQ